MPACRQGCMQTTELQLLIMFTGDMVLLYVRPGLQSEQPVLLRAGAPAPAQVGRAARCKPRQRDGPVAGSVMRRPLRMGARIQAKLRCCRCWLAS